MHVALARRTQVLLEEQQYRRLRARAQVEGVSVGAFVRAAVDRALTEDASAAGRRAAEAFLEAEPLPVGDPDTLERDLQSAYERDEP